MVTQTRGKGSLTFKAVIANKGLHIIMNDLERFKYILRQKTLKTIK